MMPGRAARGVRLFAWANRPVRRRTPSSRKRAPCRSPLRAWRYHTTMAKRNQTPLPWCLAASSICATTTRVGVPVHDDRRLFEFLILEGPALVLVDDPQQADNYAGLRPFDPEKVARFGAREVKAAGDAGSCAIVSRSNRDRNARAFSSRREFARSMLISGLRDGRPADSSRSMKQVPARTPLPTRSAKT